MACNKKCMKLSKIVVLLEGEKSDTFNVEQCVARIIFYSPYCFQ